MNRLAGIVMAALGLVIAVLSIVKVIPGLTGTGVTMILGGGLIIGLSFVSKPEEEDVEKMSTAGTLGNIFFSPTEVFRALRRHPRFLTALIIMTILSQVYANLFLSRLGPERVVNYAIDKTMDTPFVANNEDAKKRIEEGRPQAIADAKDPVKRVGQSVNGFVGSLFLYSFFALIFFVLALAMGGKINFFQALSVCVYAALPVAIIRFFLNTLLLYLKDPSDVHPILGQQSLIQDNLNFLVKASDHPVIYSLLTALSILNFYWLWLLATGLKNAGEKVSGTIAWAGAIGVYTLLILLGLILATLFPSFLS